MCVFTLQYWIQSLTEMKMHLSHIERVADTFSHVGHMDASSEVEGGVWTSITK